MIKVKGRNVTFTGKDLQWLTKESKALGMTTQTFFTGVMWEAIMKFLRKEAENARK